MKRRHLTADELKEQLRINAIVAEEYQKQRAAIPLDVQVETAIKATHRADITLQTIVLVDHFGADKAWVDEFLALERELLEQYEAGTVQLKQMLEHLKLTVGVDVEAYTDEIMTYTGISKGGDAGECKTIPEPDPGVGPEDADPVG